METNQLSADLISRVSQQAAELGIAPPVERDPLDGTFWVHLASADAANIVRRQLAESGIGSTESTGASIHVTGWDARLLRRRLGTVLAGVDDLRTEWDATAELAAYHYDRRAAVGEEPDLADVLADVEATMRRAIPLPHVAPTSGDLTNLLELIAAAEDAYEQLIAEHIEYAESSLAGRRTTGAA